MFGNYSDPFTFYTSCYTHFSSIYTQYPIMTSQYPIMTSQYPIMTSQYPIMTKGFKKKIYAPLKVPKNTAASIILKWRKIGTIKTLPRAVLPGQTEQLEERGLGQGDDKEPDGYFDRAPSSLPSRNSIPGGVRGRSSSLPSRNSIPGCVRGRSNSLPSRTSIPGGVRGRP